MRSYICTICGFLYDDESADIGPDGTRIAFEDLDQEWNCPGCGVKGNLFKIADSGRPPDLTTESKTTEERALNEVKPLKKKS